MNETFTPQDDFERTAGQLLQLFDLLPDDFFQAEGVSPSQRAINQVKQYSLFSLD